MILYFFTVWIFNMILYIKNTLIINDLCVYNLNCQYESSTIYKPMKTHIAATNSTHRVQWRPSACDSLRNNIFKVVKGLLGERGGTKKQLTSGSSLNRYYRCSWGPSLTWHNLISTGSWYEPALNGDGRAIAWPEADTASLVPVRGMNRY